LEVFTLLSLLPPFKPQGLKLGYLWAKNGPKMGQKQNGLEMIT
jgi:hypothetical protein